jgi:hypothetical protein
LISSQSDGDHSSCEPTDGCTRIPLINRDRHGCIWRCRPSSNRAFRCIISEKCTGERSPSIGPIYFSRTLRDALCFAHGIARRNIPVDTAREPGRNPSITACVSCLEFHHPETPLLWTNARITVPIEPIMVERCATYCSMIVERSARYPLDISIDYSKLETFRKSLENSFETMEKDSFKPPFTNGLKWRALKRSGGDDPLYKYYIGCYLEPLKRLSGDNISGLARWRSFELACGSLFYLLPLPNAAFNTSIFTGGTPQLERLKISHSSIRVLGGEERNNGSGWAKRTPPPFPFTPKLHEVVLSYVSMPISIHSIDPIKVRQM